MMSDTNSDQPLSSVRDESRSTEDDDVFYDSRGRENEFLDDAAILAMCDDGSEDIRGSSPGVEAAIEGGGVAPGVGVNSVPPLGFGMEGSTINISHSQDIHFGPKTVAPFSNNPRHHLPTSPVSNDTSGTPTPSFGSRDFQDEMSMASSMSSLNSSIQNMMELNNGCSTPPARELRAVPPFLGPHSEGVPSSSFMVNLDPPLSPPESGSFQSFQRNGGETCHSSSESSVKLIRKAISNPTRGDLSSSSSSLSGLQCLPHTGRMNAAAAAAPPPQMSAAINNSSNVQMGTQIVYNYYISELEQRTPHVSTGSLSETVNAITGRAAQNESNKDFILEFKEKLISVYQKRTRSSPLPWHRGKQLIPISEYYTEPQIFAVDKCGNRTSETVELTTILNSKTETRFLVEGEAGMGKTLLATKLAEEWAKGEQLQQFQILLFITLGDFKGSLQQYVREELLPSYFKTEKFEKIWEYCKTHDKEILFVLDGYDELERMDKGEIQNLMKNKDFPESKVVVTSRPNFLQDWEKKIVVSGFGQLQIMEFIEKYFRAIGNDTCGYSLRKIIEKDEKYWKLAKRPLFCVLLCMLYITGEVGESLPERQSDIMLQIILCLIKWNRKNCGNASIDFDSLPSEYEKPFYNFGKLCLNALRTEKSRFSDQEVQRVEGFESKLMQLGFLFNDNESHALGERKFWKPVHQTFLEYLGAFYIAKHIRECKGCRECKSYDIVFQRSHEVLKFCVGILNNKAYKVLDGQRFPVLWKLSVIKVLQLLREAEPKSENCQAVAKIVDQNVIEISTSEIEFEGWSYILSQPFRRLTSLKIAWRIKSKSPDQESSFTEASKSQYQSFFESLKNNESIKCIHVRAKQDGEPFTDEKMAMFFDHLQTAFLKKNLQELHIVEMKMKASSHLRKALEEVSNQPAKLRALHDLKVLRMHTFMEDKDLKGICDALAKCATSLETLHLEGLEHGHSGFQSLVRLLKGNNNIKNLHISMNQSLFVNMFESCENNSQDYAPVKMRTEHQRMNRNAGRRSKHAFTEHARSQDSESPNSEGDNTIHTTGSSVDFDRRESDRREKEHSPSGGSMVQPEINPRKELSFLFEKIPLNNGQWNLEARHFWYLRKNMSEIRIPLPLCVHREHKSVFHFLFMELPKTHVKNLTLNQAGLYLTTTDLVCLGDAVRTSTYLMSLNLQGLDKIESYLPLLIGMGQSPSLTSVNLSSSKVSVKDTAFEVICSALESNSSLRNLSLAKWQFHLQNAKDAKMRLTKLLTSWQVVHVDMKHCLIDMGGDHYSAGNLSQPQTPTSPCSQPLNAFFSIPFEHTSQTWRSLKAISLEGVELKEQTGLVRRGHLLLAGLTNFINLTSLDLSISQSRSIQVDSIALRRFFGIIGTEMKQLVELKLDCWEFCLQIRDNGTDFASLLHPCKKLKRIQLESVNEMLNNESPLNKSDNSSTSWCRLTFLHQLVSFIPNLEEISLCYYKINNCHLDQDTAFKISQCLHDHWHHTPFSVKFFNLHPDLDNVIYHTLKKPPCRVKRKSGPSLIKTYEVKSVLNIMKSINKLNELT